MSSHASGLTGLRLGLEVIGLGTVAKWEVGLVGMEGGWLGSAIAKVERFGVGACLSCKKPSWKHSEAISSSTSWSLSQTVSLRSW